MIEPDPSAQKNVGIDSEGNYLLIGGDSNDY